MFVRLLTVLTAVGLAAIGLSIAIGLHRTDPMAPLFTYPDGTPCPMPCLFGIQPGITAREDALALAAAHPMTAMLTVTDDYAQQTSAAPFRAYGSPAASRVRGDRELLGSAGPGSPQIVQLHIYAYSRLPEGPRRFHFASLANPQRVWAVCLRSFIPARPMRRPPPVGGGLATLWQRADLRQTVATLGTPDWFSHSRIGTARTYWPGELRTEAGYFGGHLIVSHVGDGVSITPARNWFSSVCVYSRDHPWGVDGLRAGTGFHSPMAQRMPWPGSGGRIWRIAR